MSYISDLWQILIKGEDMESWYIISRFSRVDGRAVEIDACIARSAADAVDWARERNPFRTTESAIVEPCCTKKRCKQARELFDLRTAEILEVEEMLRC